jgi:hypothetical protein
MNIAPQIENNLISDFNTILNIFYSQNDLSLNKFKFIWKTERMSMIHHAIPKKLLPEMYVQIIYVSILKLLYKPRNSENSFLLNINSNFIFAAIWNIGVVYCLYCAFKSHERVNDQPIRITLHYYKLLKLSLTCFKVLGIIGKEATTIFNFARKLFRFLSLHRSTFSALFKLIYF